MSEELTQCVEAGKISSSTAEILSHLSPGAYCIHRSWGFGRIAEWRLLTDQIVIDFKSKKDDYAAAVDYTSESGTKSNKRRALR